MEDISRRHMEVSKLTVSKKTLANYGQAADVLLWIQKHPVQSSHTNIVLLAKAMQLDDTDKVSGTQGALEQTIQRLLRAGLLERRGGVRRNATFLINYFHPELPPIVREGKPEELPAEEHGPVVVTSGRMPEPEPEPEEKANEPSTEEPTVETVCPEPITVKTEGGEIKLSITLNINIAR